MRWKRACMALGGTALAIASVLPVCAEDDVPGPILANGSESIVVLDEEGHPTVPSLPFSSEVGESRARDQAPLVLQDAPGGGTMIVLDERHRHAARGTVGADGVPRVECALEPAAR